MSCATTPMLKSLFMPKAGLSSIPSISAKLPNISLSAPSKLRCSCSLSASIYSPKRRSHPSTTVTHVAQTSEWAVAAEDGEADIGGGGEETYQEPPEEAKLFVGNLSYDVDSEKLAQLFEPAGVVEIAEVIYNRDTNQSRGFGFVTFGTVEEAEKAVEMFNQYDLNGRLLTVNKATERGARPERQLRVSEGSFKAYVGNLPWDIQSEDLQEMFSKHGAVVNARVVSDRETGRSRGFGFVTMASEAELNNAIANLDGESLGGRALKVNVAEERPRRF